MSVVQPFNFGPDRGWGLVTTQPIPSGTTILSETPLVCCQFSWNRLHGYEACDHCMCPLESAEANARRLSNNPSLNLLYPDCGSLLANISPTKCITCGVAYCTPQCLTQAASMYHSVICTRTMQPSAEHPIERLDEIWRHLHFPPESGSIMLLVRIVGVCLSACVSQSEASAKVVNAFQSFVSSPCESTKSTDGTETVVVSHKLLRPHFLSSLQELHEAFTHVLMHLVRQISPVQTELECRTRLEQAGLIGLLELENFKSALCMIGRNAQGIATSSFSLWARSVDDVDNLRKNAINHTQLIELDALITRVYTSIEDHVGCFLDNEGVGLYENQRLINHSCKPNCLVEFTGASSRLSVVALRPLDMNEEITISYVNQERSRHSRRKLLLSNYLFWCNCSKCAAEKLPDGTASCTSSEDEDEDEDDESMLDDAGDDA